MPREHIIIEGKVRQEHQGLTMKVMRGCKPSTMAHTFADTTCKTSVYQDA